MPAGTERTSHTVTKDSAGLTLIDFIHEELHCSKKQAKALLDSRQVTVNGQRVWMAKQELRAGDVVSLPTLSARATERHLLPILARTELLIIINKPPGILSEGKGSVEEQLRRDLRLPALAAAHRIDRDTSGCLALVTHRASLPTMIAEFREERVTKSYLAVVHGVPPSSRMIATSRIDGKRAESDIECLESRSGLSLLRIRITTGRTHQIRRHLAREGLPILGDSQYQIRPDTRFHAPRQLLHACTLSILGVTANAPIPADFEEVLHAAGIPPPP